MNATGRDRPSIAVVDHGAGNLVSMARGLTVSGADVTIVDSSTALDRFDGVVLPGVGATAPAMRTLVRTGLDRELRDYRGPLLAVCVGMQLLFEYSEEDGTDGLGILPGVVTRLAAKPLPHMGWNDVRHSGDPFLPSNRSATFYFVHSYALTDTSHPAVTATTTYGDRDFVSAVRSGRVFGTQFHPERSGDDGLALLDAFLSSTREVRRVA